jgi:hypothetical protein
VGDFRRLAWSCEFAKVEPAVLKSSAIALATRDATEILRFGKHGADEGGFCRGASRADRLRCINATDRSI